MSKLTEAPHPRWRQGCGPQFDAVVRCMESLGAEIRFDDENDTCAPFDRDTLKPVEWCDYGGPERFKELCHQLADERFIIAEKLGQDVIARIISIPFEKVLAADELIRRALAAIDEME